MPFSNVVIIPARESDMLVIEQVAKSLDLDVEDISWKQFVIAKRENKIIGIGRLRNYPDIIEIATVGVVTDEQRKGVGTLIVKDLIQRGPAEIFVTCVIPDFFNKFGFRVVKQYPPVLQKKVDFCKLYGYTDDQVFIMKFSK